MLIDAVRLALSSATAAAAERVYTGADFFGEQKRETRRRWQWPDEGYIFIFFFSKKQVKSSALPVGGQ
jgi:hypothetical protein